MKIRAAALAAWIAAGAVVFPVWGAPARAAGADGSVYGAMATGSALSVLIDSAATGGAFYVANAALPYAETTVTTGSLAQAIGSYAFDRNAVSGLYAVGSATFQANGGPAFPALPNTATSRYPGQQNAQAGLGSDTSLGPIRVRVAQASANTDANSARADVRSAGVDIDSGSDGVPAGTPLSGTIVSASAQTVRGASAVVRGGVHADVAVRVRDVAIAGVLEIAEIVSESHASDIAGARLASTVFRIVDARVNGIPVTIGEDGVRVADTTDATIPGAVAQLNAAVAGALASSGVSVSTLAPVTSRETGASAWTAGLSVQIAIPSASGVPGETIVLALGKTSASASYAPPPPPPPPPVVQGPRTMTTVTTYDGSPGFTPPPAPPAAGYTLMGRRHMPPVPLLFGLWQVSTFGWIAIAWWRRGGVAAAARA